RGELFFDMSRCREALALFEKAQQIWDSSLGAGHRYTGAVLNNIGKGRLCLGEYRGAQSALESAIRVRERELPPEHPDLAQSLVTYALVLEKLGKRREARAYRKRAESIRARHDAANAIGQTVDVSGFRQR
ncbi:MAG: tetratricopeptide repeat protein, partial [Bryobacteraceae bacterium]